MTVPADCNGVYQGDGTTCVTANCPPPNVRCCLHDGAGTCAMLSIADCEAAGGTPSVYGSDCTTPIPDTYTVTIGSNPFEDISATGLPGPFAPNYGVGMMVPLGFTFPFGGNYDRVWFNVNGFLDIGGTSSSGNFVTFPNADSATLVAPRWYRRLNGSTNNHMKYQTLGTPGVDRRFIAQWTQFPGCWVSTDTFQVVLFESGCIEFRYADIDNYNSDQCFSAGVRNTNVTSLVASNTCLHLCPNTSGSGPYQCDTYGACCKPDGTCEFTTPTACAAMLGSSYHNGLDCAAGCPVGACCNSWYATCTETTETACTNGGGGSFQGGGTECATTQCTSCAPCPADGISENEPDCGMTVDENWGWPIDYTNGGCWTPWSIDPSLPANFTSIECGQTICATSALDGVYWGVQDIDVYQVVLTQPLRLTFTVNSSFPILFGGVQQIVPGVPGCDNATGNVTPFSGIDWPGCGTASVTANCLSPGTYYFVAWPFQQAIGWWMACGAQYTAMLTCEPIGACCHEYNTACVDAVEPVYCVGPHDSYHQGQACAEVTCETPPTWGACCRGLNGTCEDNVSQENCSGPNDTWRPGDHCGDAGFSCPCFACPAGGIAENEPNGGLPVDTVNAGCNAWPPLFTPIEPGQTVCGTAFSSLEAGRRDTDWFLVTTNEPGAFLWTVTAQFDVVTGVVQQNNPGMSDCSDLTGYVYPGVMMGPCVTGSVLTEVMPAGTYFFFVAPQIATAAPWGSPYTATLQFPPRRRGPAATRRREPARRRLRRTAPAPGSGLGTTCVSNPCPQPTGSCCHADGTCAVTTQAECTGTWVLGGTCDPNPCVCGDFCGSTSAPDGLVNVNDYWYIHDGLGHCAGDPVYAAHASADLDQDGCITLVDYQTWLTCYRTANGRAFVVPKYRQRVAEPGSVPASIRSGRLSEGSQ